MARIFVSYKRQDKDIVYPIVEEIKQNTGIDCWIDMEGIESGDQFQNVIIDAIDNADIVVFMLSKNFIAPYRDEITGEIDLKKQTFPEKEVMYALRHNKRLIPISIDGTTVYDCKWLEFNCSGLDYVAWNNTIQRNKLISNILLWCDVKPSVQENIIDEIPSKKINDRFHVTTRKLRSKRNVTLLVLWAVQLLCFIYAYNCYENPFFPHFVYALISEVLLITSLVLSAISLESKK